jgi:preprotein translocase subunit SecE
LGVRCPLPLPLYGELTMSKISPNKEFSFSLFSKKTASILILLLLFTIVSFNFFGISSIHASGRFFLVIALSVLIGIVFFVSDLRHYVFEYFRGAYIESRKVVWSEKSEVIKITIIVFVFVVIMALFLWLVDVFSSWLVYNVILAWR